MSRMAANMNENLNNIWIHGSSCVDGDALFVRLIYEEYRNGYHHRWQISLASDLLHNRMLWRGVGGIVHDSRDFVVFILGSCIFTAVSMGNSIERGAGVSEEEWGLRKHRFLLAFDRLRAS